MWPFSPKRLTEIAIRVQVKRETNHVFLSSSGAKRHFFDQKSAILLSDRPGIFPDERIDLGESKTGSLGTRDRIHHQQTQH